MIVYGDPIRTVPPAALPVTLAEFKAQARVDLSDEDAIMVAYLRAAVEYVENYTGLALITSTWTQTFSALTETVGITTRNVPLILRRRPLQSVIAIDYRSDIGSPVGTTATLDPSVYAVTGIGSAMVPGRVNLAYGATWPTLYQHDEAVTVTYRAGFGDDHNAVPELIRHAVYMAASSWYNFREDVIMGSTVAELPSASKNLLRDWRPLAVA